MLKIAVCDDETIVAANIEMMLEELALKTATLINTDVFMMGVHWLIILNKEIDMILFTLI